MLDEVAVARDNVFPNRSRPAVCSVQTIGPRSNTTIARHSVLQPTAIQNVRILYAEVTKLEVQ